MINQINSRLVDCVKRGFYYLGEGVCVQTAVLWFILCAIGGLKPALASVSAPTGASVSVTDQQSIVDASSENEEMADAGDESDGEDDAIIDFTEYPDDESAASVGPITSSEPSPAAATSTTTATPVAIQQAPSASSVDTSQPNVAAPIIILPPAPSAAPQPSLTQAPPLQPTVPVAAQATPATSSSSSVVTPVARGLAAVQAADYLIGKPAKETPEEKAARLERFRARMRKEMSRKMVQAKTNRQGLVTTATTGKTLAVAKKVVARKPMGAFPGQAPK